MSKFAVGKVIEMEIRVKDTEGLERGAAEFAAALGGRRHLAFHGEMGAGKTTFISALCRVLGMEDEVTSPTFSIVNEYQGAGKRVYHFDFYRIETPEETLDLGLDDYFDSGDLCLMEWPEYIADFLPDDVTDVYISVEEDGSRLIRF